MALNKITFADKVDAVNPALPDNKRNLAADWNALKDGTNNAIDEINLNGQKFDDTESGIITGFALSVNASDSTLLDISAGSLRFSDYDGSPATVSSYTAISISPGNLTQAPDLSTVVPVEYNWPAITATDTIFFYVMGRDGNIYSTNKSPRFGEIVRDYLTIGAAQILQTTAPRTVTTIFPFQNINSCEYERSNVLTPLPVNATSAKITGNANTTLAMTAEDLYFSGLNSNESKNPNIRSYPAQNPLAFTAVFQETSGVFNFIAETDFADYVGLFDTGTADGTPLPQGSVGSNNFAVHYICLEATLGVPFIQIGTNTYSTMDAAISAISSGVEEIDLQVALQGMRNHYYLIVKGNASDFSNSAQVRLVQPTGRFFNIV